MSSIESLSAYTVVEKKELEEVNGIGYVLCHNKTKARVLIIQNDDENKVFTIGFRTPPSDDTGVPHIMEHSVLCGSKKFPVKDPFVELCKGSLNTFLNAMTYSDKTVYPVASMNKKDFHNLMHVYLDAVFYPNIYDKTEIMMQEGWHYELDDENNLKYNGVVYNEMKGVYSSAEEQLYRIIEKSLLEHTPYGYESGGDPDYITDLTQEAFLDFHRKYYHPSNSYIYLYGDMDACEELEFIDREYLSSYGYQEIDSGICEEAAFGEPRLVEQSYPLSDEDEEKDNTFLAYNTIIGNSLDKKLVMAFEIIEYALLIAPGAPIKKKLIDASIGKDVESSYDDGIKQPIFSIICKNANKQDLDNFINIVDDAIKEIIQNGIDKKSFLAAINHFEFKHKEGNFGRYPKGLMLGLNAFNTWLYDDESALYWFEVNYLFDELKKEVESGRYFEELLEKYLLNNPHKSYVVLEPQKGLGTKREEELNNKLAKIKSSMTKEEISAISENEKHLKQYQSEPSSREELETIPMLEIEDIEKKARRLNNQVSEIEMVKVVSHDIFTNGISYIGLFFDITDIDYKFYPYISLLTEIFKYVDTENYSYNELASEINLNTGGIGFNLNTISTFDSSDGDDFKIHFVVVIKSLHDKVDKAMELVDEILFTSKIDDKKRLKEIIAETSANLKNDLVSSGHITAASRVLSYISKLGAIKEYTEGIDFYRFISQLESDFDNQYEDLCDNLKTALGMILSRNNLIVDYTSDKKTEDILTAPITKLSNKLSTRLKFDRTRELKPVIKNEAFKTASQVQYVATAGNFVKKGLEYTGALSVLQTIFSYDYLWINVRVKGGAYGSMCSFSRDGNSYFTSYRDPNLMETYKIYKDAASYVRNFDADKRDMTKYIIGAIAKSDTPFTPSQEGKFNFMAYLMGMTDELLQKTRDEILGADVNKIRELAPYIEAICENDVICAIGNENKLQDARDNFYNMETI